MVWVKIQTFSKYDETSYEIRGLNLNHIWIVKI